MTSEHHWMLRTVPTALRDRYLAEGLWTDDTIGRMVAEGLADKQNVPFVIHSKTRPWRGTMGQVQQAAQAFAGTLRSRGVGPGDVVVFQLPNWVEAAITFWGASYVGAIVVPVVHVYGSKEMSHIMRVTRPKVVVTADRFGRADYLASYEPIMGESSDALWLVVGDTPAAELPAAAVPFVSALEADPVDASADVDPDAPAVIAFTSGTTRDPKGVIHSHRTLCFEARQGNMLNRRTGPPFLTGAPVGHFIGMLGTLLGSLLRPDAAVNFVDVWDPAEVLRIMLAEGLSNGGGSTYFLTSLLDHPDFSKEHLALMPCAGLGGSHIPVAVTERAARLGIRVFRAYGSTEHPSMTSSTLDDPEDKRLRTDGRALPGTELRLDEDGQILSRGADLFIGYTDPALTAQAFDEDGWFRTGDVGVLDADGFLTITDRISDIIIRGGENISAQEIEELLLALPQVAEVSVVSVPDDRLGEKAAAVLRVQPGTLAPTLADVQAHLAAAGLAKQKWPEEIHAFAEFPRTASGKVQKFQLRQQLREDRLNPSR